METKISSRGEEISSNVFVQIGNLPVVSQTDGLIYNHVRIYEASKLKGCYKREFYPWQFMSDEQKKEAIAKTLEIINSEKQ